MSPDCSLIRTILEYASPVWHAGLTKTQSDRIEGVQKRCLKIVFPDLSSEEALFVSGIEKLSDRRDKHTRDLFNDIKKPGNVLNYLLTPYEIHGDKKTNLDIRIHMLCHCVVQIYITVEQIIYCLLY